MELKSFDSKLVSLMKEENELSNEYRALLAGAEIKYKGKTLNLAGLSPFMQDINRETRKDAYQLMDGFFKENEEAGIVTGLYRKEGMKDIPENPFESEYIQGTDPRLWYVAQEIKTGPWKKIAIDDIGKGVLKYLPGVKLKYILLHTPLYVLL